MKGVLKVRKSTQIENAMHAVFPLYCRTRDGNSRRSRLVHQQGQHDKFNMLCETRARTAVDDNLESQPPGKWPYANEVLTTS